LLTSAFKEISYIASNCYTIGAVVTRPDLLTTFMRPLRCYTISDNILNICGMLWELFWESMMNIWQRNEHSYRLFGLVIWLFKKKPDLPQRYSNSHCNDDIFHKFTAGGMPFTCGWHACKCVIHWSLQYLQHCLCMFFFWFWIDQEVIEVNKQFFY
jgi:hypothetical protein